MTKQSKRIHSVTIKHMTDESPDTSWLGEYGQRATSEYSIDRAHSEDCSLNTKPVAAIEQLERINQYLCSQFNDNVTGELCDWYDDGQNFTADLVNELEECTCGERGDMGRNEYRYFNGPVENYKGAPPEDIRMYVRQDYERMESLNRGDWSFVGVRAVAEITLASPYPIAQTITSGGLWGIESDSGDYFKEVEQEQLSELRDQLYALGFSKRAIATAFKTVARDND